ncbi:uncharacterized protein JN550_013815 [Neoarthrinium moseri]|uniref:uncharacterized protein n=1 Tax=Neoarthrinium moseri TaxID=1658444 RepID=UPI001FDDA9EC|nr:uncharacterized protein JN550_013815 [Neoarthrinium moseri]KAI1856462.1 hypothetical protein JN550_013815 [Neoarthrinium moseri]
MSSLSDIHDQLNSLAHVLVFVDVVDLDNIWMCLWALVRAPNAVVHIVLSPRVLDLRVPSFAGHFAKLQAKVGLRHMLDVRDTDAEEINDLLDDEQWRDYFARDTTFQRDMHTKTHLPLYMALSALRFALKFESKGHAKTRFNFYYDPKSTDTIVPGIHHPTHVNDQLYACTTEELNSAQAILHLRGEEREMKMVGIMTQAARRLAAHLGYKSPEDILHPMEGLLQHFSGPAKDARTLVLGGGPFAEMVRFLGETDHQPLAVVAMARTLHADVNIFPNNYNDLMDLDAAMKIEDIVRKKNIPTWFFPTECAKTKMHGDNVLRACPWDFNTVELIQIFDAAKDRDSYEQATRFTRETNTLIKMHMFDVLTVVPLAHPTSLPYRKAESYWDEANGQRLIRVREVAHGPVHVFYPDAAVMESSKRIAMDEVSFVLSSFNNQTTAPA